MPYSDAVADKIVDKVLNGTDFTPPTTYYIAFCTTAGTNNATGTEPVIGTNNYSRIAVTRNTTNFPLAGGDKIITNALDITSPVSSGAWASSAAFVSVFFLDAATAGVVWFSASVPGGNQQAITGANQQLVFPAGSLTFTQAN
jgi:hypothetical protein